MQRCSEISEKRDRPVSCAQLDLKNSFAKAEHSAISDAMLAKGVPVHHVAILNSLWSQSSMLFKLSHLRAARDVKAHREFHRELPNLRW